MKIQLHRMLKALLILLVVTSGISAAHAQRYSSFNKKISNTAQTSDDELFSRLNKAEVIAVSDPEKALEMVEEVIAISLNQKNREVEADAHLLLGAINFQLSEYELSSINYEKAILIYKELNDDDGIYEVYRHVGRSVEYTGRHDKAFDYYQDFLSLAESRGNQADILLAKDYMAQLYQSQQVYDKSEAVYKDILKQEEAADNQLGVARAKRKLGKLKEDQKEYDVAANYYQESKDAAEDIDNIEEVNYAFSELSGVYEKQNKPEAQIQINEEAFKYNETRGNRSEMAKNSIDLGNVYRENNEPEKAIEYLEQSVTLLDEIEEEEAADIRTEDLELKKKALEALSSTYEAAGLRDQALKAFKTYISVEDSLNKRRETELLARAERGRLSESVQSNLVILQQDNALNEKRIDLLLKEQKLREEQLVRQQLLNYALIGGLLIMLLASFLIYRSSRAKRLANQMLMLKSLRSQMNPHFIFNALNSVNNFISTNNEKEANRYLSEFSKLMREVMENSRHDFIPLNQEIEILDRYLKLEHFRFKDKFDYTFEIDERIDRENTMIPPMLVQPYIENAVWHGLRYMDDKGRLTVRFDQKESGVEILIEDNGIGREKSRALKTANQKVMNSTGMKNTVNRVKIINDLFHTRLSVAVEDLDPKSGQGTRVCITLDDEFNDVEKMNGLKSNQVA